MNSWFKFLLAMTANQSVDVLLQPATPISASHRDLPRLSSERLRWDFYQCATATFVAIFAILSGRPMRK
jgi:hypothetical protein